MVSHIKSWPVWPVGSVRPVTPLHSGWEALTINFSNFGFLGLRVAALVYLDVFAMLKVFNDN